MADDIDFYFDFSSPYGYFASTRIDDLAAEYGRKVKWQPVLLGAVFKTTGARPLSEIPVKGKYALHDFERTACFHGVDYRQPPAFPIATLVAARAMIWIRDTFGNEKAVEFAKAMYRCYFVDGIDISQSENVLRTAALLGFDAERLSAAIAGADIKDRLRKEVDLALQRGVFGSPFIIVDGEPFWGFDRFDQINAFLRDGTIRNKNSE
jgi:2-hydroxychromene-2-carboxylate isomerase